MNPRPTGPKPVALPNCATPRHKFKQIGRGSRNRTHGTWFWRPLLYQLSYTPKNCGGEDGIRTHAALITNPNGLANRPLQPLEYFSRSCAFLAERVGFEPTVPFRITGFQDQLLKPLGHLSGCFKSNGDPSETRTPDTLIKSQVLYHLS